MGLDEDAMEEQREGKDSSLTCISAALAPAVPCFMLNDLNR